VNKQEIRKTIEQARESLERSIRNAGGDQFAQLLLLSDAVAGLFSAFEQLATAYTAPGGERAAADAEAGARRSGTGPAVAPSGADTRSVVVTVKEYRSLVERAEQAEYYKSICEAQRTVSSLLEIAEERAKTAEAALSKIHSSCCRCPGHYTPGDTAQCVISRIASLQVNLSVAEQERDAARAREAGRCP
jgi:hypothetical protein